MSRVYFNTMKFSLTIIFILMMIPKAVVGSSLQSSNIQTERSEAESPRIIREVKADGTIIETRMLDGENAAVTKVTRIIPSDPDQLRVVLVFYNDGSVYAVKESSEHGVLDNFDRANANYYEVTGKMFGKLVWQGNKPIGDVAGVFGSEILKILTSNQVRR